MSRAPGLRYGENSPLCFQHLLCAVIIGLSPPESFVSEGVRSFLLSSQWEPLTLECRTQLTQSSPSTAHTVLLIQALVPFKCPYLSCSRDWAASLTHSWSGLALACDLPPGSFCLLLWSCAPRLPGLVKFPFCLWPGHHRSLPRCPTLKSKTYTNAIGDSWYIFMFVCLFIFIQLLTIANGHKHCLKVISTLTGGGLNSPPQDQRWHTLRTDPARCPIFICNVFSEKSLSFFPYF